MTVTTDSFWDGHEKSHGQGEHEGSSTGIFLILDRIYSGLESGMHVFAW